MTDVVRKQGRRVLDGVSVGGQGEAAVEGNEALKLPEVLPHVPLPRSDQDGADAGDHVPHDKPPMLRLVEAKMAGRVARRVQGDPALRRGAVQKNFFTIPEVPGDRVRDPRGGGLVSPEREPESLGKKTGTGHVILVVMRRKERDELAAFRAEPPSPGKPGLLLVRVGRGWFDQQDLPLAEGVAVGVGGRGERGGTRGKQRKPRGNGTRSKHGGPSMPQEGRRLGSRVRRGVPAGAKPR